MKMLKKQANMAFLLISIATIVPAYGNEKVTIDNQEETMINTENANVVWYKRAKVRKGLEAACVAGTFAAIFAGMWYMEVFKLLGTVKQPCNVCKARQAYLEKYGLKDIYNPCQSNYPF